MNLNLYSLFDDKEKKYFSPAVGIDDKDFCSYILEQLNVSIDMIKDEKEKSIFVNRIRSCSLMRLGSIDELTGELLPDKQFLIDFKDFKKGEFENEVH